MIAERNAEDKSRRWRVNVPLAEGWAVTEIMAHDEVDFLVCVGLEKDGKRIDPPYARWDTGKRAFIDEPRLQAEPWFGDELKDRVNEAISSAREGETLVVRLEIDREVDGRWTGECRDVSGVVVYGATADEAASMAKALALRVLASKIEGGKHPDLGSVVFEVG